MKIYDNKSFILFLKRNKMLTVDNHFYDTRPETTKDRLSGKDCVYKKDLNKNTYILPNQNWLHFPLLLIQCRVNPKISN